MNPDEFILKSITISTEKFYNFLSMSNEDAGEFFKSLLQYAIDGTHPKMSDPWKLTMYNMYENSVTEQMAANQKKRDKASRQAKEREKIKKEALKLLKSEKSKTKVASSKATSAEDILSASNSVVAKPTENGNENDIDIGTNKVVTSAPEVTSEDLSFSHFVSVLGKRDSMQKYDETAVSKWQAMSDESKRKALTWVANYVTANPDVNSRQFPCALIDSHPWS